MRFIGGVIEKLQRHPKRLVFPEGAEPRVLQAARQFYSLRLGAPILLGDRNRIRETATVLKISLEGIRIVNPAESDELDNFTRRFEVLQRYKGMKGFEAREAMLQPNYFAAMMLAMHQADGFVAGANQTTAGVLRPPVSNHQNGAANRNRLQLHGHGGGGLALWRRRRSFHGGLRRHRRPHGRTAL